MPLILNVKRLYRHQNQIRALVMLEKEAMGGRRVPIKRIENNYKRGATFCKRRNGLMEKARQLSIRCGSSVALLFVSSTGKYYSFSSGDSMANILRHCEMENDDDGRTVEYICSKFEEEKDDNESVESLISMEEQLQNALSVTRARKIELMMELVKTLHDKEKLLKEENQVLANQMGEMMKKLHEREEERAMSLQNSSCNDTPETLPLLK